jgi:alkyldihydroxyacetonephosphate synthase
VCAGIRPDARAVVVDLKRMARVRRLDLRAPLVEVEAGHMGVPLERTLGRSGMTLGHFPSSILCSTVGGWVATRSAGQCSGTYGKIEDMTAGLECVTGAGDVVSLSRRTSGPDLVPLVLGSEGTLAVVTSATFRLHPAPASRAFGAWSFPSTEQGWEAMRAVFQAGIRPAVARLYDPFDAMLARQRRRGGGDRHERRSPGEGGAALRALLGRPRVLNELLHSRLAARVLGGALLIVVVEGTNHACLDGLAQTRAIVESMRGSWEGEAPARRWLDRRYAVSYRQAPVFAKGAFVDTFEVAATWSDLGRLYESVRRALGEHVFVMAHFSHAYPDGCCVYFSFLGAAGSRAARGGGWEDACADVYDRAWSGAIAAAIEAGGTLSHHHGVGRSKAPRLGDELGPGIDVLRAAKRACDPAGILNPGNLLPTAPRTRTPAAIPTPDGAAIAIDAKSLLVRVEGAVDLATLERTLNGADLTLAVALPSPAPTVSQWLARGAPGSRDRWLDPVDHLLAGLETTLNDGRRIAIRPAPRRAVGPDLTALFLGTQERVGRIDRAWLRVHRRSAPLATSAAFVHDRDRPIDAAEGRLFDAIVRAIEGG